VITVEPQKANRLIHSGQVMLLSSRLEMRANLMAVNWVTWISCDPPLLGVSIAPSCFTHKILRQSGDFVLCIPDASQVSLVHEVGTISGHSLDKFRVFDVPTHWGQMVKALTLTYSIGAMECEVVDYQKIGDHGFFVAQVLYAGAEESVWDGRWMPEAELLFYVGGDRYLAGGRIVQPKVRVDYYTLRDRRLKREQEARDLFDAPSRRIPEDLR